MNFCVSVDSFHWIPRPSFLPLFVAELSMLKPLICSLSRVFVVVFCPCHAVAFGCLVRSTFLASYHFFMSFTFAVICSLLLPIHRHGVCSSVCMLYACCVHFYLRRTPINCFHLARTVVFSTSLSIPPSLPTVCAPVLLACCVYLPQIFSMQAFLLLYAKKSVAIELYVIFKSNTW